MPSQIMYWVRFSRMRSRTCPGIECSYVDERAISVSFVCGFQYCRPCLNRPLGGRKDLFGNPRHTTKEVRGFPVVLDELLSDGLFDGRIHKSPIATRRDASTSP